MSYTSTQWMAIYWNETPNPSSLQEPSPHLATHCETDMENLAQELIDAIIKEASSYTFVDYEPCPTLYATSLVCRSWLRISQRLLLHSVDLGFGIENQEKSRKYQQLYGALLESPHLAGYIKYLAINMTIGRALPLFLRKLDNLEGLTLHVLCGTYWGDLDLDLRQAVFWVFQLPSMRDATIYVPFVTTNELTSFLYHTRFLTSLSLYDGINQLLLEGEVGQQDDVTGQQEDEDKLERFDLPVGKSGHLSQLLLQFIYKFDYPSFIAWLLGPDSRVNVENIHTLSIFSIWHHLHGDSIHKLLHTIAIPLKRLELGIYDDEVPNPMRMKYNSEEKSLVFSYVCMSASAVDQLSWLLRLISLFNIFGPIERVELCMGSTHQPGVTGQEWSGWGTSDRFLTEFKCLKSLVIMWREEEPWVETADVEAMFPSLSKRRPLLLQKQPTAPIKIILDFEEAPMY